MKKNKRNFFFFTNIYVSLYIFLLLNIDKISISLPFHTKKRKEEILNICKLSLDVTKLLLFVTLLMSTQLSDEKISH